jgi:hypothetical protein
MANYEIVEHEDWIQLVKMVQAAIDQGWVPQGGVAAVYNESNKEQYFYQALYFAPGSVRPVRPKKK